MSDRYIDADGHILEPPAALRDYTDREWSDRVLHFEQDHDGTEWMVWNGHRTIGNPYAVAGTAGLPDETRRLAVGGQLRYSEVRPSVFYPAGYIADMDAEGIAAAVLYPSILLNLAAFDDNDFACAQAVAYNRYISDFVSEHPNRLFAAAVLPERDPQAAGDELRRASRLPGIVAAMIRPNQILGRPFSDPCYRPLWAAAAETGLPVALHPAAGTGVNSIAEAIGITVLRNSSQPLDSANLVTHQSDNAFFPSCLAQADVMNAMMFLLAGGVCEHYPDLRLVFLEANGGWLVPWLERLDHKAAAYPWDVPDLRLPPSEYFQRQCWISFDPDESALAFTAQSPLCGADRIVWASDYPHQDAKPGVTKDLDRALAPLAPDDRALIRSDNAIALYNLPSGLASRMQ